MMIQPNSIGNFTELEAKILSFLLMNPPTASRRVWYNVAFHIGMTRDEKVKDALEKLRNQNLVHREPIGKGHRWALTSSFQALR